MNPEPTPPPSNVRDLFLKALELQGADRDAFLAKACGSNESLRSRVSDLLRNHRDDTFLETPAPGLDETVLCATQPLTEGPGSVIGRYKLLQQIGEGGMGVVYMAEQEQPVRRRVALKIIKVGMDTKTVVARFEAERQALALMDHPNIAKVLDAGATDTGRPYFVMELVRGVPITEYCDKNHLASQDRLELFIPVCQAIQHAHQKGIIHRDIKPSNVLVSLHDGQAMPVIIDFGIAKATNQQLTEKTYFTNFTQMIGTPAYMSPEQAEMSRLDVDTRADIYSLGVLLYELLTGTTPFLTKDLMDAGYMGMQRIIAEQDPPRPSTRLNTMQEAQRTTVAQNRRSEPAGLTRLFQGDLDWIVMKCLEKDRSRRYETTNALAADLRRHLGNEPVAARPPSSVYRLQKAWRRNRIAFSAGLACLVTLVVGLTVAAQGWKRARRDRDQAILATAGEQAQTLRAQQALKKAEQERQHAETARLEALASEQVARRNLYVADVLAAQTLLNEGNFGAAQPLLRAHIPKSGQPDFRGWEWRYLAGRLRGDQRRVIGKHTETVTALAVSPDSKTLASGDMRGTLKIWNLDLEPPLPVHELKLDDWIYRVEFSSSGKEIAARDIQHNFCIWDARPDRARALLSRELAASFAFIPNSRDIAILQTNGIVTLRNLDTGASRDLPPVFASPHEYPTVIPGDWSGSICASSDGKRLAATGTGRWFRVWNLADGSSSFFVSPSAADRGEPFTSVSFVHTSPRIVTGNMGTGIELWTLEGGPIRVVGEVADRNLVFNQVALNGGWVALTGYDHTLRIWDADLRRQERRLHGHRSEVWSIAVAPNGIVYTGGQDRQILEWELGAKPGSTLETGKLGETWVGGGEILLTRDGSHAATGSESGHAILVNAATGTHRKIQAIGSPLGFSENGSRLYLAEIVDERSPATWLSGWTATGRLLTVDVATGEMVSAPYGTRLSKPSADWCMSRNMVGFVDRDHPTQVHLTEILSGESRGTIEREHDGPPDIAVSPDGSHLVLCNWDTTDTDRTPSVWRLNPLQKIATLPGHSRAAVAACFSPDGRRVVTASHDGTLRVWNAATWQLEPAGVLRGHKRGMSDVSFSPDGRTLASSNDDGTVRLWNADSKGQLLSLEVGGAVRHVVFSPDSKTILISRGSNLYSSDRIEIIRAPSLQEAETQVRLSEEVLDSK